MCKRRSYAALDLAPTNRTPRRVDSSCLPNCEQPLASHTGSTRRKTILRIPRPWPSPSLLDRADVDGPASTDFEGDALDELRSGLGFQEKQTESFLLNPEIGGEHYLPPSHSNIPILARAQ